MPEVNFEVRKGLTVPRGTAAAPSVVFDPADLNTGLYSPGADQLALATNGAGRLFVDANGRMGVGTSSPSRNFVLTGSAVTYLKVTEASLGETATDGFDFMIDSGANAYLWNRENGTLQLATNNTERLRITSAGLVGIGTSAPGGPLDVVFTNAAVYSTTTSANIAFAAINNSATTGSFASVSLSSRNTANAGCTVNLLGISTSTNNASDFAIQQRTTAGVFRENMRITHDGKVGIGTTSPTDPLDVNGDLIRIRTAKTPASATDTGVAGEICWDANYVYVCTATNTWKRSALSTW